MFGEKSYLCHRQILLLYKMAHGVRNNFKHSIVLIVTFLCFSISVYATTPYKIALVHSYERNYPDAGRYRSLLEKELERRGLKFEIREYFLDCEELEYYLELARASFFIDEFAEWGADMVAVFNNQAVYSLLKCNNPKLRDLRVVFSGVYCPEVELLRQYPNVTGYVDIPDYFRTLQMIERLVGKARVIVMSGIGMINNQIWSDLTEQCRARGIQTYDGDVLQHVLTHRIIREGLYDERKEVFDNEKIDTTVVVRMMCETLPLRTIQLTARGTQTYFMLTARTFSSLDAADFFVNPSFSTINECFGTKDNMLGGYFVPLETQMKDMAEGISLRLRGEMPSQQMIQSRKEYVLNWCAIKLYGLSTKKLPDEYKVMYIPFSVRYRYYIVSVAIFGGVMVLFVILFLTHRLMYERRRKREALRDLYYEHETLKLAIEGDTTYAWRKVGEGLNFDSHFYKLIASPKKLIHLDMLLSFVHPDDSERFKRSFLQTEKNGDFKEQYRCKFDGEYQWWEFRYRFILNQGDVPVVNGLLQNIQEIKDREAELIRNRQLAEQAELKQSFLNNMSHEIRTPLNAIVGFSNILISEPELSEEEKQEFIGLINMNNDLLLNLIGNILELSRIDSGEASFDVREENVRTLLHSYYNTFRVQVNPSLTFLCEYPENKDAFILVDSRRLQQVVTNFLTNANKFTTAGFIKLGYCYIPEDHTVRIYVEDTGKGIPATELKMIFGRFYKRDEFAQGTGLGLSICRSIVSRMNGKIEVESEEGKGSRFSVVFPCVRVVESSE